MISHWDSPSLLQSFTPKEIRESTGPIEFETVYNYAYLFNILTLVLVYALYVPIIAPIGLGYFCVKHWVDKYQMMKNIVVSCISLTSPA